MTHDPATLAAGAAMSRPTDPLRDRIASYLISRGDYAASGEADAILALVREHATSDAAVEAASDAYFAAPDGMSLRAAITAALGGGDG